jgi:hypothetical protein
MLIVRKRHKSVDDASFALSKSSGRKQSKHRCQNRTAPAPCLQNVQGVSQKNQTRRTTKLLTSRRLSFWRVVEFFHPILRFEHFARLGAVWGPDDTVPFHQVDQSRRATVADAQPALKR